MFLTYDLYFPGKISSYLSLLNEGISKTQISPVKCSHTRASPFSPTHWEVPVVFVPKKNGMLRLRVDCRRLNAITIRDTHSIPRMDKCINSCRVSKVFSVLDVNSGYRQILIAQRERDKTMFTTNFDTYAFTHLPFSLRCAPVTYQRGIDII